MPEPAAPGPGQVLIDVEWCGICGTDVEEYTDGPLVIPTTPHPLTGLAAPMIVGHEVSGRVVAVGSGVELAVDTLVALDGYVYCGRCRSCAHHQFNICERWAHIGMSYPGGLAERMLVPAALAIPASGEISSDELALSEPYSVAVRAVRRAQLRIGERVVVIGAGTIGLATLQVLRTAGAGEVVVVDPLAHRRAKALDLSADGVAASIDELVAPTPEFDLAIDCTGSSDVPDAALALLRPGGRLVLVGIPPQPGTLDYKRLVLRELSIIGTVGHVFDEDSAAAVRMVSTRRVDAASLISHRIPLERAVTDGIEFLAGAGRATALKILVSPRLRP